MKIMKERVDLIADYADYSWDLTFYEKMRFQSFNVISKQV